MISVIIPTYNAALLIGRAIRSVLDQRDVPEFEILIIDDCSSDNTLEVVRGIADGRIRVFRQSENRGPAAARNRGLREARGEYSAFLDGDDFWEPEFLKATSDFLNSHPEAVAVSVMQCHKIIGKEPVLSPRGVGIDRPVLLEDFFAFWGKYNHVCTGSVLMRTDVARQVGGQREDLRVCEDLEFWAMLATYGPWGFIPKVLFTSDGGAVTRKIGVYKKNFLRMSCVKNVQEWGTRLSARLSISQKQEIIPVLNRITIPGTYSLLYIGQYRRAYRNIQYYQPNGRDVPIIVRCARCGFLGMLGFGVLYRLYRFFKDIFNSIAR